MENSNQNNNPQSEIKDLNQPQENVPEKEAENKVTDLNYYEILGVSTTATAVFRLDKSFL